MYKLPLLQSNSTTNLVLQTTFGETSFQPNDTRKPRKSISFLFTIIRALWRVINLHTNVILQTLLILANHSFTWRGLDSSFLLQQLENEQKTNCISLIYSKLNKKISCSVFIRV
jgi:hypothetical protein